MKSNEFNNVSVTNEKNNISSEFTKAQNTEYSFQSENPTTIKDELNDRHIVNDDPEENLLKATKEKEERKKENKNENEELESTSATGSEASMASSAGASASSAGGAVAGVAASAATAAIVVIGAVAGLELIEDPNKTQDLVTFISEEAGINDFSFSFAMPGELLSYDESQSGGDRRKEVVAKVVNDKGFDKTFYIPEYEPLDDGTYVFFGYIEELSENTDYVLLLQIEELAYDEQEEYLNYVDLAYHPFRTLPFRQKVLFHPLDVTYNSVSFAFDAALVDLGVDPADPQMPTVYAYIQDNDAYSAELQLSQYDWIDDYNVTVYGEFTGLSPETYYNIDIFLDYIGGELLGSASFTTYERTTSIVFEEIYDSRDYVNFTFTVDKEEIGYVGATTVPAVLYSINSTDETISDQAYAQSFEEVDDTRVRGSGSFTGLTPNLEYNLTISLSTEGELITLSETTFDTKSEFNFQKGPDVEPTSTSTVILISIRSTYIGYVSEELTPDAVNKLSIEIVKKGSSDNPFIYSFEPVSFTSGKYAVIPTNDLDGLAPNTDYELSVYYQFDNVRELLGTAEFTTAPDPYGFYFHTATPAENSCEFAFDLSATAVASNDVYLCVAYDSNGISTELTSVPVTEFEQSQSDPNAQTGTVTVEGLPAEANLTALVYGEPSGGSGSTTIYGSKTFTTGTSSYSFALGDMTLDVTTASIGFSINPDAFSESTRELVTSISLEYRAASGSPDFETASPQDFQQTTVGIATSSFELSDLNPGEYYYGIVYYQGDSKIPLGIFDFTTMEEPPEVNNVLTNWEVVQDLNSNYRMPIKIDHDGSTDDYGTNFFVNFSVPGVSDQIQAFVPVSNDYDYAIFTDNTIAQYLSNQTHMSYTITCSKTQQVSLASGDNVTPIDVATAGTSNSIYGWKDPNPDLYDSSEVTFSFGLVAALVDTSYDTSITFTTPAGTNYTYSVDLSDFNYVSNVTVNLLRSTSMAINYDTLKNNFNNKALTVTIQYFKDGNTSDTITVAENFMFNFMN